MTAVYWLLGTAAYLAIAIFLAKCLALNSKLNRDEKPSSE